MIPNSSGNWQVKIDKGQNQDFLGNLHYSKFGVHLTGLQFFHDGVCQENDDNMEATGNINHHGQWENHTKKFK